MENWIYSESSSEDIVIGSKISLARNFEKYLFTDKMSIEDAQKNIDSIYNLALNSMNEVELTLVKLWESEYKSVKAYMESQVISNELLKRSDRGAFIVNRDETISIMLNEEDHVKIQCISSGLNLQEIYEEVNDIDDIIEKFSEYAFHEDYGYLTANPSNVGTGMRASVIIHLPALTASKGIPNILKGLNQVGMTISTMYEENNKFNSNIYEISNKITIGVSEDEIISNLEAVVLNIISEEKKAREVLLGKYNYEIEDRIFRAYGILENARILTAKEVLEFVSSIRLGVELSLLNINKKIVNRLLIETRDSVIQSKSNKNLSVREKNVKRANVVKQIFSE